MPKLNSAYKSHSNYPTSLSVPQPIALQHLPFQFPARIARFMGERAGIIPDKRWVEMRQKDLNRLAALLSDDTYEAKGKTTFKEEFVTAGGGYILATWISPICKASVWQDFTLQVRYSTSTG